MNAFQELRRQATKKRDAALKLAEREYAATLRKIEDLEQQFITDEPQKARAQRRGVPGRGRPDGEMTLAEAMHSVLRTHGPLRKVEICVRVLEMGYKTIVTRRSLASYAGTLLRTQRNLFKYEDGKWTLVSK